MTIRPKGPIKPLPSAVEEKVYEVAEVDTTCVKVTAESGETEQIPISQLQAGLAENVYITMQLQKRGGVWVRAELPEVPVVRPHEVSRPAPVSAAPFQPEAGSLLEPNSAPAELQRISPARLSMAFSGVSGKVFKVDSEAVQVIVGGKRQIVRIAQFKNPELLRHEAIVMPLDDGTWVVAGDPKSPQPQLFPGAQPVKPGAFVIGKPGVSMTGKPGMNGRVSIVPRSPPGTSPLVSPQQSLKPGSAAAASTQSPQLSILPKLGPPMQVNPSNVPPTSQVPAKPVPSQLPQGMASIPPYQSPPVPVNPPQFPQGQASVAPRQHPTVSMKPGPPQGQASVVPQQHPPVPMKPGLPQGQVSVAQQHPTVPMKPGLPQGQASVAQQHPTVPMKPGLPQGQASVAPQQRPSIPMKPGLPQGPASPQQRPPVSVNPPQQPGKPGSAPQQVNSAPQVNPPPPQQTPPRVPLPAMSANGAKPGVNAPSFLAKPGQMASSQATTVEIIDVSQEGKVRVSAGTAHETFEIPISSIVSKDEGQVQYSQLGQGMKLIRSENNKFKVIGELRQQSNYLNPDMLTEVYSKQQMSSMIAVSEFVSERFDGIYYSRGKSVSRSLSVYICQCMLFEDLLRTQPQKDPFSPLISESFQFGLPYSPLNLKHKDFESAYSEAIERIEQVVAPLLTANEGLDFGPIAEKLKVWIVVLEQQGSSCERKRVFPANARARRMQKVVLIGKPPYPVAVSRKLGALFDSPHPLQISIENFVLHGLSYDPPRHKPELSQRLQTLKEFRKELEEMSKSIPEFAGILLRRFEEMIQGNELGQKFCSGEYAQAVRELWEKLIEASNTEVAIIEQEEELLKPVAASSGSVAASSDPKQTKASPLKSLYETLRPALDTNLAYFSKPCDWCQSRCCDWTLECSHKLCEQCIGQILHAAAGAGLVLQAREESTTVSCPVCQTMIMKQTVKENDSKKYNQLMGFLENVSNCLTCCQCGQTVPRQLCFSASCRHFNCYKCLRERAYCKCGVELASAVVDMNLAQLACDGCGASINFYFLPPVLCPQSHVLCGSCSYQSCKFGKCGGRDCGRAYSEQDLAALKGWAMPRCSGCSQDLHATEFIDTNCPCWICRTCAVSFANQYYTMGCCWYCRAPFPEATSKSLFRSTAPGTNAQCCCFCYNYGYEIELFCGDKAHLACIKDKVMRCEDTEERVECGFCCVELYPDTVYSCVNYTDIPNYYKLQTTECRWVCSACRKTDETYDVDPEATQAIPVACQSCGSQECILCTTFYAYDHACSYVVGRLKAKDLEKQKKCAVMCPKCKITVEREASPVQQCSTCGTQFCSECVVNMGVISAHGKSYHRPDCSQHTGELLGSAQNEKCPKCVFFGHQDCEPPKRLRRRGIPPPGISF